MQNSGNEMAYFMAMLGIVAFVASFFIDKIDFKNQQKKSHH